MTRISDEIGDTFGLYAMYGAIIAKRLANNMISGFQSAFTIDEKTRTAYFRDKGIADPRNGRYTRAVASLEPLHAASHDDPEIKLNLGLSFVMTGRVKEGVILLEKVYRSNKSDVKHAIVLGIAYFKAEEYGKAVPLLEKASQAAPENFSVRYKLGTAYDNLRDTTKPSRRSRRPWN